MGTNLTGHRWLLVDIMERSVDFILWFFFFFLVNPGHKELCSNEEDGCLDTVFLPSVSIRKCSALNVECLDCHCIKAK